GSRNTSCKFDLTFNFIEANSGLYLGLEYNTDLFRRTTVLRMLTHLEHLLKEIINYPLTSIENLNYLDDQEKKEVLDLFNPKPIKFKGPETLVELFNQSVISNPEKPCVVFKGSILTYEELDAVTNQFSNYLRQRYNTQPDDVIALQLDRSESMIIAMLSVLKSGAAYLPIDLNSPSQRTRFMLQDSKAKLLIDDEEIAAFQSVKEEYSKDAEPCSCTSNSLAYVIYTSGSTGQPKGVMVENQSIVNLIKGFKLNNDLRSVLTTDYTFDVSVLEIYSVLTTGGTLFIPEKEVIMDVDRFVEFLLHNRINHAYIHPMLLKLVADSLENSAANQLQSILTGVQSIKQDDVNWYLDKGITVYNGYGPTETTVCSTILKLDPNEEYSGTYIPIGSPIANTRIYILDDSMNLCGIGTKGQIYIAGNGLSRGYLNAKEATSNAFVPDPFFSGKTMYKSGDYGRWLENGCIEFNGRGDNQVKINGFRVEAGEVQAAILSIDVVLDVVVKAYTSEGNEKYLIAYVVAEKVATPELIESELQKLVPHYMIPQHLVRMNALPMTANGKVDMKALPSPDELGLDNRVEFVAARNPIEERLVAIWEELLGTSEIGIHDNFFALGGNSLKVIRLVSKINREFGLKYDLKGVYEESTIALIGEKIRVDGWFKESLLDEEKEYEEIKF
ncbi:MAG: amino acid adenylation domain-containing protein, partial [Flavobacteriales bacterium]|nr:amino acid adenylation domain-containing protein [Flavobacteriales bacterium]